jgi:hypothetical protein
MTSPRLSPGSTLQRWPALAVDASSFMKSGSITCDNKRDEKGLPPSGMPREKKKNSQGEAWPAAPATASHFLSPSSLTLAAGGTYSTPRFIAISFSMVHVGSSASLLALNFLKSGME